MKRSLPWFNGKAGLLVDVRLDGIPLEFDHVVTAGSGILESDVEDVLVFVNLVVRVDHPFEFNFLGAVVDHFDALPDQSVGVEDGAEMHEGDLLVEVDPQLVAGQGHRGAFDVDVDRDLLSLMVLHADQQTVLEPTAGVVEHCDYDLLILLFVQHPRSRLAQQTDTLVVSQVYFLRSVEFSVADESPAHF